MFSTIFALCSSLAFAFFVQEDCGCPHSVVFEICFKEDKMPDLKDKKNIINMLISICVRSETPPPHTNRLNVMFQLSSRYFYKIFEIFFELYIVCSASVSCFVFVVI